MAKAIELINDSDTSRRDFCRQACHAASLAALGVILPGCGGSSPTGPSGTGAPALPVVSSGISGGVFMLTVDAASPLATVGNAVLVQASGQQFLVARTGADTFQALTATCTHEACTVSGYTSQTYVCPCHGSRYNTAGAVLSGPAPRSLTQFASSFVGTTLTVTVS